MSGAATTASRGVALRRLTNILGGSAGNLVEWFDWFAYAAFSVYFAPIFFPEGDETTQFLQAAIVFGVGFLARPLGAWLMGVYADRKGRKAALTLSVGMMCAGSLIIALLPGYATVGMAAPVLLTVARLIQGLSVGGEYGASATYVSEMASSKSRGFWSGFLYVTLIGGQLLAVLLLLILQTLLTPQDLEQWGWRVPFFIGAGLAVVVFWLRRGIHETASFTQADAQEGRGKTMLLFLGYPKQTLAIFLLTAAGGLGFYVYTTYMQKLLINSAAGPDGSGFSRDAASAIMTSVLLVFMILQPIVGWISDQIGRRIVLVASFGIGAVITYPMFLAITQATSAVAAVGLCLIPLVVLSGYTSISAIIKAELFPAHVRALGVAVPYSLGQALFGGNAEAVALAFKRAGAEGSFFVLMSVILAIGCVVAILVGDTKAKSLILED
ncbi:MFS transporter [Phenylobacterium sp.]|jgi:MHS family alpha-ketoglutarate permease-like MFS transporter|uniref:MFS transporter n=1 Tax=Phenylobacterium sp. TaxID=1871053 RepID=UPI00378475E8